MDVFKIIVMFAGENEKQFQTCDAVEHAGKTWLVPKWTISPDDQWLMPVIAIPSDRLRLVRFSRIDDPAIRFATGDKPPRAIFFPPIPQQLADLYGVDFQSPIRIPNQVEST